MSGQEGTELSPQTHQKACSPRTEDKVYQSLTRFNEAHTLACVEAGVAKEVSSTNTPEVKFSGVSHHCLVVTLWKVYKQCHQSAKRVDFRWQDFLPGSRATVLDTSL